MTRLSIAFLLTLACQAQEYHYPPVTRIQRSEPSQRWVYVPCLFHASMALADGLSSWHQPESNGFMADHQRFSASSAGKLSLFTGGVIAVSYALGRLRPKWRPYIGVLNLSMGSAHLGATAWNVSQNPR